MTILKTILNSADEIAKKLAEEDCEEQVTMHISKNTGIIRLKINEETYARNGLGEWKKITY